MKFDLQSFTSSRLGIALALGIGRFLPPRFGFPLTERIAKWLVLNKKVEMVRAVRANQWVVANQSVSSEDLDELVYMTFRHQIRCLYLYYRHLYDPSTSKDLIEITPEFARVIERSKENTDPTVLVGLHMSNFDLVAYNAAQHGLDALGLALGNPSAGHEWQYEIRRKYGFNVVTAGIDTIRQAEKRLKKGGTVITGIDRPLEVSKYHPKFFGHSAALPVIHIHLALRTNTPVRLITPIMDEHGIFKVLASDSISMDNFGDKKTTITKNAEKVLAVAEEFIRMAPYQWVMFLPVWPTVTSALPNEEV